MDADLKQRLAELLLIDTTANILEWIVPLKEDSLLRWFRFNHLPQHLQEASEPFGRLALEIVNMVPASAERTTALRRVLEAKDCIVRATIVLHESPEA